MRVIMTWKSVCYYCPNKLLPNTKYTSRWYM